MEQGKPLMQSNSPLVDFDAVCQKVREAVEPNRTHAVSLHDEAGDVLWLSESSMGPDEHNAVREAAEAFSNPAAAPILSYDLGDSRSAVMVRAVNARRAIVGLIMIVMDTRIVAQGAPKLMTPEIAARPDAIRRHAPGSRSCDSRSATPGRARAARRLQRPRTHRAHAPTSRAAHAPAGPAPLSVGPRTIAAQLEQIVSRGSVRAPAANPAKASRPATYVSHVSAARPGHTHPPRRRSTRSTRSPAARAAPACATRAAAEEVAGTGGETAGPTRECRRK